MQKLVLMLALTTNLLADFFAFRTLSHPVTEKKVYLLYDAHVSREQDGNLDTQVGLDNIIASKFKTPSAGLNSHFELVNEINEKVIKPLYENMPNLLKQQNDLIDIIKKYHFSLIDEDWPQFNNPTENFSMGRSSSYYNYVNKLVGQQKKCKDFTYRINVTPMAGIGNKLVGKYTSQEIIPIEHNTCYFYNVDKRDTALYEAANKEVNEDSLKTMDELFDTYNQKAVIIAEGFFHIIPIAQELINNGYEMGKLVFNEQLQNKIDNKLLSSADIEYLRKIKANEPVENDLSDSLTCQLADNPLDVKAIFAKEYPIFKGFSKLAQIAASAKVTLPGLLPQMHYHSTHAKIFKPGERFECEKGKGSGRERIVQPRFFQEEIETPDLQKLD